MIRSMRLVAGLTMVVPATVIGAQGSVAATPATGSRTESAAGTVPAQGRETPLQRRVTLRLRDVTVERALEEVDRQAELGLVYTMQVVPLERRVTVELDSVTAERALEEILRGTAVGVEVTPAGQVVLVRKVTSSPVARRDSTRVIAGRVTAKETGIGLPDANVQLQGSALQATSSDSGGFVIHNVPAGRWRIVARRIGYRPLERDIVVPDSGTVEVNFALEQHTPRLEELVTTATGPQRRMDLGNAVTVLRADSIVRTQPIKDVTDLLETRVPGLTTLHTTGAPGDPTRLRLRGSSSILRTNDPIIIVDGMRVHSDQSDARSASLAWAETADDRSSAVPAPSPLDRIDPNSIETIEVLNGPSAATLYGADAANGVIVVTTKRGRPGPARWDASMSYGRSEMPGRFPDAYIQFAHDTERGFPVTCVPPNGLECTVDSVLAYQVLNDPDLTVLGRGHRSSTSLTVSGGRPDIGYAITGSFSDETGLLKLPQYEVERFREAFGRNPEDWMERPHQLTRWGFSSRFDFRPSPSADVAVTLSVAEDEQGRSTLEGQLQALRGVYVDKTSGLIYGNGVTLPPTQSLVPDFYRRTTNRATAVRTGLNLNWRPLERLTVRGDVGLSTDSRRDESLLPRGLRSVETGEQAGFYATGQGTVRSATLNAGASYVVPLTWGFQLETAVGFNYVNTARADLARRVNDPGGVGEGTSTHSSHDLSSHGWFIAPRISHQRFSLETGLRLDSGSEYGARAGGFAMPKIGASWLISDEPFFPLKDSHLVSLLRLRAAYGQAGVQPGPADRLRLLQPGSTQLGGETVATGSLATLGNTKLRPERSTEFEWGLDADLFGGALSVGLSGYRKTKKDAHLNVPVAASVNGGGNVLVNVGVVRNTGFELSLGANWLRANPMSWNTQLQISRNRNLVVSLAEGVDAFGLGGPCGNGRQCIRAGYPLFGYWERPIIGYIDANGDGVLGNAEMLLSDSAAYLGAPEPEYTAAVHTTVGLFRDALTLSATLDYQDGLTQQNAGALTSGEIALAARDPSAPLDHQALAVAAAVGSNYGLFQTVSALRFHSLSLGWRLPTAAARWLRVQQGSLAVQVTNLGLITSYRGKDPLVNSVATGNAVVDAGALPQPREWRLQLNFTY